MKTLEQFADDVSKERGYDDFSQVEMYFEIAIVGVLKEANIRHAAHVWEEAIAAQKLIDAEHAVNSDLLCGDAINRKLNNKTNCGKWCGGCDSPVFDKDSILNAPDAVNPFKK